MLVQLLRRHLKKDTPSMSKIDTEGSSPIIVTVAENEASKAISKQLEKGGRLYRDVQTFLITGNDPRTMNMITSSLVLCRGSPGVPLPAAMIAQHSAHKPESSVDDMQSELQQQQRMPQPDLFVIRSHICFLMKFGDVQECEVTVSRGPPLSGREKWLGVTGSQLLQLHIVDLAFCDESDLEGIGAKTARYIDRVVLKEMCNSHCCAFLSVNSSPEAKEKARRLCDLTYSQLVTRQSVRCYICGSGRDAFFAQPWDFLAMWAGDRVGHGD
jgi:hypothetical protein